MNTGSIINVTMELTCLAVSLALITSLVVTKAYKNKLVRIFLWLVTVNCGILVFDAISWFYNGVAGEHVIAILRLSNFFVYVLGQLYAVLTTYYVITYISGRREGFEKVARPLMLSMLALGFVLVLTTIVSQFTGWLYTFDEHNAIHFEPLTMVINLVAFLELLVLLVVILSNKKHLAKKDIFILLLFHLFTAVGLIIENIYQDFMALYLATTLSFVAMYVSIQVQAEVTAARKESEAKTALMLSQIQPHFLFNALSSISALCDVAPQGVKGAVQSFAHYLRGNLESLDGRDLIPFEDELTHLETYLSLEKLRHGDELSIEYDIEIENFSLPPLTVQPIAENAVRHGIAKKEGGGTVRVSTRLENDRVRITVSDDGVGFDSQTAEGQYEHAGIDNVRTRLAAQCGGTLTIVSTPGDGTTATIIVPNITEEGVSA